ncbi:MAG: hypothetical protein LBI34_03595 [Puniceicoccales bacterium]|nr:hypothetical protein [Puniceicoccales bacterium]
MNTIQENGSREYVVAISKKDRCGPCDGPTDRVLVQSLPDGTFPNGDDASDENAARLRLILLVAQYPECAEGIQHRYRQLNAEGMDDISASRIISAEMRKMREMIIAAREAPQRKRLADIAADVAAIDEELVRAWVETEQAQAETARIQAENAQLDEGKARLRGTMVCGGTMAIFVAFGGLFGIPGALLGAVVGLFPASLYHFFGNGRHGGAANS